MAYKIGSLFEHIKNTKEYRYTSVEYNEYLAVDKFGTQTEEFFDCRIMGIQSESDAYLIGCDAKEIYKAFCGRDTLKNESKSLYFKQYLSTYPGSRKIIAENLGVRMKDATLKDHKLLIRVLQLGEKRYDKTLTHDEYKQTVLDICQRYGLILWDDGIDELRFADDIPEEGRDRILPIDQIATYGFEESHLGDIIDRLYERFLSWSFLIWKDLDAGRRMLPGQTDESKIEEECTHVLGLNTPSTKLELRVSMIDGNPVPVYISKTLIDALSAQLTDIILSGVNWLDGRSIYRCAGCGSSFIRSRNNATLCEECRTPAAKARATRLRQKQKKEEQGDGKEARQQ
ncbi:hypothetical protein LJC74_06360 [Eubacteriales bacterium OttesenSCG-928-A19]|nr:hypothetical protein [Eubacteriales bacterium OttesenSCG-928-A19]